jgi:heptose I phosphotransferase
MRRSGSGVSSLAGNEWEWTRRLTNDGIPCVQAVAFGEEFTGSHERRSAILTAGVPGQSLERWVVQWRDADRLTIQRLITATAALISRLHGQGYIHRDLYLSHVFYDPSPPIERSLSLIDLQRVIRPRWRFRRWMVKDLASLNFSTPSRLVSRTDRVRWLRRYLGTEKLDASARRLVYRVVGKTQRIAERAQRKRR